MLNKYAREDIPRLEFVLVQMQMTSVFRVAENVSRFRKHLLRKRRGRCDASFLRQKVGLAPLFPRFQRIALGFAGKANAKPLVDVQTHDLHARTARKVLAFLPERSVGGFVELADAKLNANR